MAARLSPRPERCLRIASGMSGDGQAHHEARATLGPVLSGDASAMPVRDPSRDGKAEADPAVRGGSRPIEPIEDARQLVVRDSRSGAVHPQHGTSIRLFQTDTDPGTRWRV